MRKELDVAYRSDDYGDFPDKVVIELTDKQLDTIRKSITFMEENKDVFSVNVECDIDELLDDEGNESDFVTDAEYITVYTSGRCYVFAQNKYTAQLNFESEEFTI